MTAMTNSKDEQVREALAGIQAAPQAINTASGRNGAFSGDAYEITALKARMFKAYRGQVQGL